MTLGIVSLDSGRGERPVPSPWSRNSTGYNRRWIEFSERKEWAKAERKAGVAHIKPNPAGRHYYTTTRRLRLKAARIFTD
jgi:hypothetical protein